MRNDIYRTRLAKSMDKRVLKFLSSLNEDNWILEEDIIGTEAHSIMLYEQNILSLSEIKKILKSLNKIKIEMNKKIINKHSNKFEDIHPLIEKLIIDDVGMDIGGKIHTGRSRNDQVCVDLRLRIRKEIIMLSKILFNLLDILIPISKSSKKTYMPLYTHFQKAQLGVFSHYINNYNLQILRMIERLYEVFQRVNLNPLGACAIGATSINIDRERTAELLGFENNIYNSIDAISSRDYIYESLTLLSLCSLQFSRIAEDLLIWSTKEFDFINIDEGFCSVSSVMPQKKNPDSLELIRGKCSKLSSNVMNAALLLKALPTGYFRDLQELKPILEDSFSKIKAIIDILAGIFSTIKINNNKMKSSIKNSYILALDLAELMVNELKIPFRKAHNMVGLIVKESNHLEDLFDIKIINNKIKEHIGSDFILIKESMDYLKDFNLILKRRDIIGSPSEKQINITLKMIEKEKNKLLDLFISKQKELEKSTQLRKNLIQKLLS
ncbi:MAG: argininosuccinate lyase [Candidatus Lokiarchaeota archaeon]|nr:argininosuccinate lyase [Candidatus Lokiarchaeota archaeon]MBD3201040.1 argininosuccinate lyase [Candidatus Lokiarchaeota archaeon]